MGKTNGCKNEFWVEPIAGLGNRMQALASAHFLAEKHHKRLCILWNNDSDLAADFEDVFQAIPGVRVVRVTTDGYHTKPLLRLKSEIIRKIIISKCDFVTEVDEWGPGPEMRLGGIYPFIDEKIRHVKNIYVKSWAVFAPIYEDQKITMDFLKPSEKVRQRGKDLFDRIGANTVGVHIRRTDHVEAIADSPVAAFFQEMQKELEQDNTCHFFVATDDGEVEQEVFHRFGDRVFFKADKSWGRTYTDGMLDACVDLWALSKCRKILGSKGSTFGLIAAKLGSKELKIVTK